MSITVWIKKFLAFVLPVIGTAATKAIADEVVKYAYKDEPPYRRNRYYGVSRTNARSQHPSMSTFTQKGTGRKATIPTDEIFDRKFHDVLMIAFDITGYSPAAVREFLMERMPTPGKVETAEQGQINLDDWWIADDEVSLDDRDSAVFVSKGNQAAARTLLREHGLVG